MRMATWSPATPARSTSPAATRKAVLPANYTFIVADNGKHTFSATLETAGTQSITATDTVHSNLTGSAMEPVYSSTAFATFVKRTRRRKGPGWGPTVLMATTSWAPPSTTPVIPPTPASPPRVITPTPGRRTRPTCAVFRTPAVPVGSPPPGTAQLHGDREPDRRPGPHPRPVRGRLGQPGAERADPDRHRVHRDRAGHRDPLVVRQRRLRGLGRQRDREDHDLGAGRLQRRTQWVVLRPTPAAAATFVKTDTTTQGTWMGTYGANGYNVVGATINNPSYPAYASVTASGYNTYTWAANTTDVRGLQNPSGSGRIAAAWYGSSFTVTVNLTDGQAHTLALYAVDWDNHGRSEQIQITNAATGAVLDTETLSSFVNGAYEVWTISGHVTITISVLKGGNALLNGLFFGLRHPRRLRLRHPRPRAPPRSSRRTRRRRGPGWGPMVPMATTSSAPRPTIPVIPLTPASPPRVIRPTPGRRIRPTCAVFRTPVVPVGSPPPGTARASRWTSTSPTATPTPLPCTRSTGTTTGGRSRSRSPTRPPGPCWTPRLSRRSSTAPTRSGRSVAT